MGQRSNDAVARDVQTKSSKEECALSMGQRKSDASSKDVSMESSKEECALGTGQISNTNYAAAKGAQIMPSVEEYVGGTGHIARHKMNLLRLDQNST